MSGELNWDVVMVYAPPWDGPTRFSKHHLACYLAGHGARVLYEEAPLTPLGIKRGPRFVQELQQTCKPPRQVARNLWVRRHFLPVPYHAASALTSSRTANQVGQRWLAPRITADIRRMRMQRPIVIAGLPHAADLAPRLAKRALVYHCADDYGAVRGFPATLPQLERQLCQQADLVITTSETLCQTRRAFNPNTYWIPNGADVSHFAQRVEPAAELQALKQPIIGFVGGLSEWVDLELIGHLARRRPNWTFVLVGPLGIDPHPVAGLDNVRLFGPRPYAQLPGYLAAMNVALIPFKHNEVTYHADPIKAYEYLAAGVPVVATDMPALRRLAHVIRLADSPGAFTAQIDAALAEGRDAKAAERAAEAARHSWGSRFDDLVKLIESRLTTCAS